MIERELIARILSLEESVADLERVASPRIRLRDWTPSYSASGSMTYTSVSTVFAKYIIFGKILFFELRAAGTTGGTASNTLIATLPVNKLSPGSSICAGGWNETGNANFLAATAALTQTTIYILKYDRSNFGLGTGRVMAAAGFYEIP